MKRTQAAAISDMNEETRKALKNPETWLRLPVMALFVAMLLIATPLLIALALYAWVMLLFKAEVPESVVRYGKDLGAWFDRTSRYLCGAANRRPFPFEDLDCPRDPVPGARPTPPARKSAPATAPVGEGSTRASTEDDSDYADSKAGGEQDAGKAEPVASKSESGETGKSAGSKKTASKGATKRAGGGKKAASKKSASKKSANKKSAVKKSGAGKASGKKAVKKSPAKGSVGTEKSANEKTGEPTADPGRPSGTDSDGSGD